MRLKIQRLKPLVILMLLILGSIINSHPLLAQVEEFELIAENKHLALFMKPTTTEIAVMDKQSGQVWYSNPPDRDYAETLARGTTKTALGAQLIINYFDPLDNRQIRDNFNHSILFNQFTIAPLNNGVRIDYLIGEQVEQQSILPVIVGEEKFEELFEQMDMMDQWLISDYYELVTVAESKRGRNEKGVIAGYELTYPDRDMDIDEQEILGEILVEHFIKYKVGIKDKAQLKKEDLEPLVGVNFYMLKQREIDMLAWDVEDMIAIFGRLGFDQHAISDENVKHGLDPIQGNVEVFSIPLEYYLEDENLVVRVPASEIKYPVNVIDEYGRRTTYPLVSVEVLPFFGAAGLEDEGYMLVPDGSGALIKLNNGKVTANPYEQTIYGRDLGLTQPAVVPPAAKEAHLPVYGMKRNDQAFLAIIEEGDTTGRINADISGRRYSYNAVWPRFILINQDRASLQGSTPEAWGATIQWRVQRKTINTYQNQMYSGDLKIRFAFLSDDQADYSGMARYYRNYLVEKYNLTRVNAGKGIPFFLELVGAIHDYQPVMGVRTEVIVPLTTYEQAKRIIFDLSREGIEQERFKLTYTGWLQRGVHHTFTNKILPEGALGGRKGFNSLVKFMNDRRIDFFPAVDFINVYDDHLLDGFQSRRDALRYMDGNYALPKLESNYFDAVTGRAKIGPAYIISSLRFPTLTDRFLLDFSKYELSGIYLQNIGNQLNSDFTKRNRERTRDWVRDMIVAQTAKFSAEAKVQVSGGNVYLLPLIDNIKNIPMTSSGYNIVDQDIPFYQMVLHGYIPFTGEPINFAADYRDELLKLLETGGYPYYLGYYRSASALKETCFDRLYTGSYQDWLEEAVLVYHRLNAELAAVQSLEIVKHEQLADGVFATTYENGMVIMVNYNDEPVRIGDRVIEGKGYYRLEGDR